VFIIDDNSNSNNTIDIPDPIGFIPLGGTGPDHILVSNKTNTVYTSLKHDDFIALIDMSNKTVKEQIILQEPRAMSLNPTNNLLYVASGDSHWFNAINMSTNKVISANMQISYPVASVTNNITGNVYVANCLLCDDLDFTNGASIYELYSNSSAVVWKTFENIDIEENGLTINPFTNRLYAMGTDIQSGRSNLYIIDIS
jgi:DNA-binding beta-propeller fold protein YncE